MAVSEHWDKVKRLFDAALETEPERRDAFLEEHCSGDPQLCNEVKSLLSSLEEAGSFIQAPALSGAAMAPPVDEEADGPSDRRIGAYLLNRPIARGGMGTVYLAVRADDQYQKRVAIKLIKRGMDTDSILRRFRNERQILAGLDHPNIAKLLDGGTTPEDLPYFVMDYIDGKPIDEYCTVHKLSIDERLRLFRSVCSAVQYAHQNLVVHRDIKPGNILVTAEGVPKLLDFGIAKLLNPEISYQTLDPTAAEIRPMTPEYASPEQIRGDTITTASDVYSLGVLLYKLLTGRQPYLINTRQPQELAQLVCDSEPDRMSTAVTRLDPPGNEDAAKGKPSVPELPIGARKELAARLRRRLAGDLDNIVMMAMRKEPQRRYASVEQLSEDIRRHLAGLPVIARKDTLGYRSAKFIKRHKAGVVAAVLVVAALMAGMVATAWQAGVARTQRAKAEQRFDDVRRLANSFLFEFHDAIEKLPGSTPARALVVRRALEYLDSLARETRENPELSRELATAYEKVGDIQGNPYSANLGDTPGAMQSYQKALAIFQKLYSSAPENAEARRDLASSYDRIADILGLTHDLAGALQNYRQALQLRESLAAGSESEVQFRRDLGKSYENIGDTLIKTGDAAAALESFRKALAIDESMSLKDPANLRVKRSLAVKYNKVGLALANLRDKTGALENAQKSLALFESLATAEPTNGQARRELALAYNRAGDHLWDAQRQTEALEAYRKGLAIHEALSSADPQNAQARHDLAVSYGNVGYALAQAGDENGGLGHTRKSQALFEALAAADPTNVVARRDLAISYSYLGDVYGMLASNAASASRKIELWREARSWYQKSLNIYLEMRSSGTLRGADAGKPDEIGRQIADCDAALAKLQGAAPGLDKR